MGGIFPVHFVTTTDVRSRDSLDLGTYKTERENDRHTWYATPKRFISLLFWGCAFFPKLCTV